jgi:hypothetical protein
MILHFLLLDILIFLIVHISGKFRAKNFVCISTASIATCGVMKLAIERERIFKRHEVSIQVPSWGALIRWTKAYATINQVDAIKFSQRTNTNSSYIVTYCKKTSYLSA